MINRDALYKLSEDKTSIDFLSNREMNVGFRIDDLLKQGFTFSTYSVTQNEVNRPDLISQKLYGEVGYWWIIMKLNNIENPLTDVFAGLMLKYIPKDRIDKFIQKSLGKIK